MGLVAREPELAVIADVLDRAPADVRALVLVGEPGVGKTSLWEVGLAHGSARGMRVLVARASASETGLPFAGLIDLLDEVSGADLDDVPPPQRHALEVALYRADPGEHPPTDQVVSLALLSTLRSLARREHVLVAVDDLQWLDPPSQLALAYASRRLPDHATLLLARRPGAATPVEQALPDERLGSLTVGALSLGGTRQLLAARLGLRLPHHLLRRVYDTTLGNPLFALEVGRLLSGRDPELVGDDLPVPDAVEDLLGLRVADLHPAARRVLLALALAADLRTAQVAALAGADAVEEAVRAHVVQAQGDRIRPTHPLLAEAARRAASADDVRRLHADLAAIVSDDQRQVLHLALAATGPDRRLAARLDAAVRGATARGSIRLAADLAGHALRLTPVGEPDAARVMVLAKLLQMAGDKHRLTELLAPRAASLPDRADRVRAHVLLTGGVVHGNDDILRHLQQALDEAGDDSGLRLRVLCHLAENEAVIEVRNVEVADRKAAEAVAASAAGSAGDQRLALYTRVWTSALRGRPLDGLLERYEALASGSTYLARTPGRVAGQQHVWRGEPGPARARFEAFRSLAAERGEPSPYALARLHLCELELRVGRLDAAEELLDEWAASLDSSLLHWPMYERCRSLLAAGRGDAARAREWGGRAVAQAEEMGVRWDWLEATRALGVAALLDHRPEEAVRHLRTVWAHTRREGVLDPGAFPAAPDLVEALVEVGDPAGAREVVDVLAEAADVQDHPWARLASGRGRAAVALASGWSDDVAADLAGVAASYARLGLAADAARTWLLLGRAQRRSRKWGAARESLGCAVGLYEQMAAPGWAAAARAELERVGARRPGGGRLTATERRVADLAADGLSNKEIARVLVVTVSTVEFHLRNTYSKLGIRSRMELAQGLAAVDEPAP
ncbi:helix-turn-helix transcriptional regulator [Nocardioides xinjiangensis]|uniref:helix-turn-helix transcriptional regulator n=1 Tax=Nocardioides xinjiangensis TaxID=2817376 RepID=UPI001B304E49|nr:LuxR family transcriptional regulator [Nocardioides sp. SYSU D00514]